MAVEVSQKEWVVGAQVPGYDKKAKRKIGPDETELLVLIEDYCRRAAAAGQRVERVVVTYEAGYSGFWLARLLHQRPDIQVHVIHPTSVPVSRHKRRAKSDAIDVDLLLRTLLAWLRGEPRVCTMVPIPSVEEEDARRLMRERDILVKERLQITNRIASVLRTLGVNGYQPKHRDRHQRLEALRTPTGEPLPPHAHAMIKRLLARLELVMEQIRAVEAERDAVLKQPAADAAEHMIQQLVRLSGIGVQSAALLVRECFVRSFASAKALGSYAGLTGTPYNSGSSTREQGIDKAGNARLRATMVELAWLWPRYQPDSALAAWFRQRLGDGKGRVRKVLTVALARKLLIALWRFATAGVVPAGARLGAEAAL